MRDLVINFKYNACEIEVDVLGVKEMQFIGIRACLIITSYLLIVLFAYFVYGSRHKCLFRYVIAWVIDNLC